MALIEEIPDFVNGMALKDDHKQNAQVKSQVAPYQSVAGPVDGSGLHGREDVYELEEQR